MSVKNPRNPIREMTSKTDGFLVGVRMWTTTQQIARRVIRSQVVRSLYLRQQLGRHGCRQLMGGSIRR